MSELNLRNLKQEVKAESTSFESIIKEKVEEPVEAKLTPRELNINIEYDTPEGKIITDTLVSRILDADTRMQMTRLVSRLSAGMLFDELPYLDRVRLLALARCFTQIKDLPAWAEEWLAVDDDLLFLLNAKLVEHETKFFRRDNSQSEEGQTKSRIRFSQTVPSTTSNPEQSKKSSSRR